MGEVLTGGRATEAARNLALPFLNRHQLIGEPNGGVRKPGWQVIVPKKARTGFGNCNPHARHPQIIHRSLMKLRR
jgi:hypothetical protein